MGNAFDLTLSPLVHFGAGKIAVAPSAVKTFGSRALLITGARSFTTSLQYQNLLEQFQKNSIHFQRHVVAGGESVAGYRVADRRGLSGSISIATEGEIDLVSQ